MNLKKKRKTEEDIQKNIEKNESMDDKYNFALYIPEITHKNWEIKDEKVILHFKVLHPLTRFSGVLAGKKPKKDMTFDEMSSKAWLLIDGEKSIFEIARELSKETDDEFKEDLRRLVEFIKFASKKGWVRYKEVKNKEDINI
nr:PqqD family protein [Tissierella sp.]